MTARSATAVFPEADMPDRDAGGLDEAQAWHAFSRPRAGGTTLEWESFVTVDGMHCAACSIAVEQAIGAVPGVAEVSVNPASHLARVVWSDAGAGPDAWLAALARAGYRAVPALHGAQAMQRRQAARLMLWRWLVAGFCMMQVMMYAVPAYLAAPGEMTADMTRLMQWASWVLTLPVLAFCCAPFFASAWRDLRRGVVGMDVPVALGILVAFMASSAVTFGAQPGDAAVAAAVGPAGDAGGQVWYDSITMFVFFLLSGRMLELRLRERTAGALEALSNRLPETTLRRLADGSYVRVPVHRLVAGDVVRVLPGEAMPADGCVIDGATQVNESLLTGESRPVHRMQGEPVLAGSINLSAPVVLRVTAAGADTRYAGIVALMRGASTDKPRLALLADRIAGPFLLLVMAASAGAALWWWPAGAARATGVAIAVLIVTCPCALSLATPAAMLAAAGALARGGTLVRRLQAFEAAAGIDTVIFDKTGTLTQGEMHVGAVHARTGHSREEMLLLAAALGRHSLHPASRAVADAVAGAVKGVAPGDVPVAEDVHEVAGKGVEGRVGGMRLRLGSSSWTGATGLREHDGPQVHLSDGKGWLASFEIDEAVRGDAIATIAALKSLGLRVQLLSGDQARAVARLAGRVGIEGAFSERSPEDKLAHVALLQKSGHRVAMVGDGINDAPVLARADVSMSFAQAAAVSRSQADFVFMGTKLAPVVQVITQAHRTRRVVRQNLAWALLYNAVSVPLAIAALMPPWLAGLGMAGSSLLVICNAARLSVMPARQG